ncbi:hypothetical protein BHM03_00019188 [Ensete ventricosum]|nr:hypothetical protein BHM03_00019188 [Ensete ventricosum]
MADESGEAEWEVVGTKTPRRRKRDQETIACLASDWSMYIHLRQNQKLLSSSSAQERLCVRRSGRQQWLGVAVGGLFHDDASSRH